MKIATLNLNGHTWIRSIEEKMFSTDVDVMVCQETHLYSDERITSQFNWTALSINRHEQTSFKRYGGLLVLWRSHVPLRVKKRIKTNYGYFIFASVQQYTLVAIYLLPGLTSDQRREFEELVSPVMRHGAVLIGDMNARHPDWDVCKGRNGNGTTVRSLCRRFHGSIRYPRDWTFQTRNGLYRSTIDLMVLSADMRGAAVGVTDSGVDSDHRLCIYDAAFCLRAPLGPIITPGMLQNAKLRDRASQYYDSNGQQCLAELNTMGAAHPDDVQRVICNFLLAPWRQMKPPGRRQDPFWTKELEDLLKARESARREYELHRTSIKRHFYQQAKNCFARRYRRTRKAKLKRWRAELNEARGREAKKRLSGIVKATRWKDQRNSAGSSDVDPEAIQDFLVSYRHDPLTEKSVLPFAESNEWADGMNWKLIYSSLEDICAHLSPRKAPGTSQVTQEMLRLCPQWGAQALLILLQTIARCGTLPEMWGEAIVCPIEKNSHPCRPQDYRPICLLDILRKACERVVNVGVRNIVQYHPGQFGFRQRMSTYDAICKVVAACHALDKSPVIVLLDLTKAYDLVRTAKLMEIIEARIPTGFLRSMCTLLCRPPRIQVRGCTHFSQVTTGVPQGSSLSPSLFNLYMDTLLHRLDAEHSLFRGRLPWCSSAFADDLALICQSAAHAQRLLHCCMQWGSRYGYALESRQMPGGGSPRPEDRTLLERPPAHTRLQWPLPWH